MLQKILEPYFSHLYDLFNTTLKKRKVLMTIMMSLKTSARMLKISLFLLLFITTCSIKIRCNLDAENYTHVVGR